MARDLLELCSPELVKPCGVAAWATVRWCNWLAVLIQGTSVQKQLLLRRYPSHRVCAGDLCWPQLTSCYLFLNKPGWVKSNVFSKYVIKCRGGQYAHMWFNFSYVIRHLKCLNIYALVPYHKERRANSKPIIFHPFSQSPKWPNQDFVM